MRKMKRTTVDAIISYGIVTIAFIIAQSMINNGAMTRALKGQMIPICVYIVMAVSLNLVVGISGELSLGHAGFMSIGAFTGAIVSTWLLGAMNVQNTTVRLIIALVSGGILAGAAGALIAVVGDLSASAIKRDMKIKDYGTLIPGHGGILDRFDSILFTAPVVYILAAALSTLTIKL